MRLADRSALSGGSDVAGSLGRLVDSQYRITEVANPHDAELNRDQLIAKAKFICGRIIDGDMTAYDGAKIIWNE